MTEGGQQSGQQPGRGRSGRGRGGRRRGGGQAQERRAQNSNVSNLSETQSPTSVQPPSPAVHDAGASPSANGRGAGGGRRGARYPRRGGGGESRRGGGGGESRRGGGEPRQRAAHGGRRTFGGHLTSGAASNSNSLSAASLSVDAPEFVPGQQTPATRNGASGVAGPSSRSAPSKKEPKSTASDLPTRIHEDINNGHYERVEKHRMGGAAQAVIHPSPRSQLLITAGVEKKPTLILSRDFHLTPATRHVLNRGQPVRTHAVWCAMPAPVPRCTETSYANGWSCAEICGDLLPCGEHECSQPCHSGLCGSCEIPIPSFCYCGKEHKDIACEQRGEKVASYDHGQVDDDAHASDAVTDG
ncbi:hypothetical protein PG997_004728 [Apiospora hydei]|uniref:Uncharacterized protein n=1 Tax=Apiospora hydei TaxID=1337664 RepID=A0ABR1X2Y1_9PEZI